MFSVIQGSRAADTTMPMLETGKGRPGGLSGGTGRGGEYAEQRVSAAIPKKIKSHVQIETRIGLGAAGHISNFWDVSGEGYHRCQKGNCKQKSLNKMHSQLLILTQVFSLKGDLSVDVMGVETNLNLLLEQNRE